ncbi:serpin [Sphaerisporangium rufum]|uniref:Serpin n=1 Tax=Sphaerisporangium rufum TaxID=1381558 RepID=A0A919V2U3_9ACTN|nr:serpin family protein [Sphaerisporangium rufum]GII80067.1 serpin [Sphaerisporangium rufum]
MTVDRFGRVGRRDLFALALPAATMAVLAGCGTEGGDARVLTAPGVRRETPPPDLPLSDVVHGMTGFGHALYAAVARPDANAVLSPLSVACAFAMARAGARGAAAAALDRVFGFPAAGPHQAFNALTRRIVTSDGPPPDDEDEDAATRPPVVAVANGLFVQQDATVGAEFLRTLAAQYGAGVRSVDFTAGAAREINAWVDRQTAGRIKKLFDRLSPQTRLVIANAVYLKARWLFPFEEPAGERGAAFTRADGGQVRTDLMRKHEVFPYAAGPGWQAVALPYVRGELAMWVLVPARGTAPGGMLAPDRLREVRDGLADAPVRVAIPRWDFATGLDLEPALRRLGLGAIFDDGADFSGIAPGLSVGQVAHRANITVDEMGTEAAAATGMAMAVSAPAEPVAEVRADHPFAFAIMHTPTATPLFIGHVAEPAAAR